MADGKTVVAWAMGGEQAYVFGNSAGANIALKITQDHPQLVRALVDHYSQCS
ncbi:alpha/beta hydrolase [Silvimonas sp.]|uniref:alpha/beta fold hydrolase n=1 Tax=Silvimonas sp. TaxID=2650811 RepID=UPI0028404837|nr:alpha/beta hydrolase [Silvimonas sp.]MDR3427362.1 alpha/beta hydrolase [Silvimonas sp.]